MNYTETRIPHRESSRKKRQHQAGIGCFPHMPAIPALGSPGTGCQTSLSYRASPGPCSDFSGYALTVQLSSGFLVESNPRGLLTLTLLIFPSFSFQFTVSPLYHSFHEPPSHSGPIFVPSTHIIFNSPRSFFLLSWTCDLPS